MIRSISSRARGARIIGSGVAVVAGLVLATRLGLCAADEIVTGRNAVAAPITNGLRVFTAGHSFHVWVAPMLADMAAKAGIDGHQIAGLSSIGGSRVIQHWELPDGKNKVRPALASGNVDVLTLSPIWLPDDGIEKLTRFGLEHNPNLRVTVQEYWLPNDTFHPVYPLETKVKVDHNATNLAELRHQNELYKQTIEDLVRKLNGSFGRDVLSVVPVGDASITLREKIVAGKARPLMVQWNLFRDNWGHPTAPLRVLAAYCHFAVIYRRSPVGLPMPQELIENKDFAVPALNQLLQEAAWDAVVHNPLSGVHVPATPPSPP